MWESWPYILVYYGMWVYYNPIQWGMGKHRYEIDKISTHTTDGHKQHVVMLFKPILNHHASYGV